MNQFFTDIFYDLNLKATSEPGTSEGLTFVCIENNQGIELSRFQIQRELVLNTQLNIEQIGKLKTLFYNNIWPQKNSIISSEDLIGFINSNYPSNTAIEKQGRVLSYLYSRIRFDGDEFSLSKNEFIKEQNWRYAFVKNHNEFFFYLNYLIESGYVSSTNTMKDVYSGVTLTVKGLDKAIILEEETNSKTCFVAMSFDSEMFKVYESSIRPAIIETGFEPLIISEKKDIPSDTTINDAILAAIKKSKFTIADFTKHKHGVYFESGYALGRGQKVIYTCRADEILGAHFDTRNYPHIVWKDAEDLKQQLINKIEIFIKS